jgi:hypothetical protein
MIEPAIIAPDRDQPPPDHHALVHGGFTLLIARRLGFEPPTARRRFMKVLVLVAVTWVPLLVLSALAGHAWGHSVAEPLLFDPVIYSRFLFVLPVLELAQVAVEASLGVQVRHLRHSGIVPAPELPELDNALETVVHLRRSFVAEVAMAVVSLTLCVAMRVFVGHPVPGSTWERVGTTITPAGWWYIVVSLPIVGFFLLRWMWVFLLWAWFLIRVSQFDLELTATHPDRCGGLGFLGWGVASFSLVLMAVSAVLSGSFAREILHRGSTLDNLKYHVIVFAVLSIVILHIPLFVFIRRQARLRFRALLEFGDLARRHDRAFDEKWVEHPVAGPEKLLGSPDVSSLAGIAQAFEHVDRMQLFPFDKKAVLVLAISALIPMIPLVGTAIPITEIISKLGEFMV